MEYKVLIILMVKVLTKTIKINEKIKNYLKVVFMIEKNNDLEETIIEKIFLYWMMMEIKKLFLLDLN
jgi:hypothetical protein